MLATLIGMHVCLGAEVDSFDATGVDTFLQGLPTNQERAYLRLKP